MPPFLPPHAIVATDPVQGSYGPIPMRCLYQRLFTVLKEDLPELVDALDHAISLIEKEP